MSHGRLRNPGIETPLRAALEFDGPIRVLKALAVACAFRGQGGAVAEEAMEHALQDMLHRDEEQICVVVGRIHRENRASQNLAERMGFELLDDLTEVDNLQAWFIVIEADDDLEAE